MELHCRLLVLCGLIGLLWASSDGQELSDTTPGTSACKEDQFRCVNGRIRCILREYWCDRMKDCADGSDEVGCPEERIKCREDNFECSRGGKCIPYEDVCDGAKDCPNGADEEERECEKPCRYNYFQCKGPYGRKAKRCIPNHWLCARKGDEDKDCDCHYCEDESTEACALRQAQLVCERHRQRMCADTECVRRWSWCNGQPDCSDGSDEDNCPTTTPQPSVTTQQLQFNATTGPTQQTMKPPLFYLPTGPTQQTMKPPLFYLPTGPTQQTMNPPLFHVPAGPMQQTRTTSAKTTLRTMLSSVTPSTTVSITYTPLTVKPAPSLVAPIFPLASLGYIIGLSSGACLLILLIGGGVFWLRQRNRSRADATPKRRLP